MIKPLVILFFLFWNLFFYGQENYMDSISELCDKSTNSEKLDIISKIPYDKFVGDLSISEKLFIEFAKLSKEMGKDSICGEINQKLSIVYQLKANYPSSIEKALEAIRIFEALDEEALVGGVYASLGFSLKDYDLDLGNEYMLTGITKAEKSKDVKLLQSMYNNYGTLKKMEGNADSAFYFYSKSLAITRDRNDSIGIPYSLDKIGELKMEASSFVEANQLFQESYAIRLLRNDAYGIIDSELYIGDLQFTMDKYQMAINYYLKAYQKCGNNYSHLAKYALKKLAESYRLINDFEQAYQYQVRYDELKDSLLNESKNNEIASLQIKFETEKKDRKIAEGAVEIYNQRTINAEKELENKQKTTQLILSLIFALFLVVVIFVIYAYQKQKRYNQRVKFGLKTKLINAENQKKIDDEKLRVSRELHDNIGAQLTFMISSIDNLSYVEKNEPTEKKLTTISDFGRGTMKELRNTIWAMKNSDGELGLLIIKIRELAHNIEVPLIVEDKCDNSIKLSSVQLLNLFRLVQEFSQNTVKYAHAANINIRFTQKNGQLEIVLSDDGKGFNLDEVESGNGLKNMEFRCLESGGTFTVTSDPSGTCVICLLELSDQNIIQN